MGIPVQRILEIALPPDRCYEMMRDYYLDFITHWYDEHFQEHKDDYISSRPEAVNEEEIVCSFEYIRSLPRKPIVEDIISLARNVQNSCLSYSRHDDLYEGFQLGIYADFIICRLCP